MTPIHHPRMSHPFQGEGDPPGPKGRRCTSLLQAPRRGGAKGRGTVMSHPFQEGVGGRDESPKEGWGAVMSHPKRGGGTVMSHPKGGTREEGGSTNHYQGEG